MPYDCGIASMPADIQTETQARLETPWAMAPRRFRVAILVILSGNSTVCELENGPLIVDLPMKNGYFP